MRSNSNISEKIISSTQYINEENYWLNQLSGQLEKSTFPCDFKRTGEYKTRIEHIKFTVPGEIYAKIIEISKGSAPKIYMILTAGLIGLLDKYSYERNKDIIIGAPIYKQETQGEFINTVLALKNRVDEHMSFKELLRQVRQTIIKANENANYPIETLLYQLDLPAAAGEFPLFDVAILLKNIHDRNYLKDINLNVIFSFFKTGENIQGVVEYNALLYEKITIQRIVRHYTQLLKGVLYNPDSLMYQVEILLEEEKQQVLYGFNQTGFKFPDDRTVNQLFEKQANTIPGNTAVVYEDKHLTYGGLNEKANSLARVLQCKGVNRDIIVGIMVSRCLEMITGLLAVLKAGGAYLPIDPDYPEARKKFMLEDSQAQLIMTQKELLHQNNNIPGTISREEMIDLQDENNYSDKTNNMLYNKPDDLIYVIYTSGTTGNPKGVLIGHKGFVNLVYAHQKVFGENPGSRISQTASISFDAMAFETWPCLLNGASLYIAGNNIRMDPAKMKEWLISREITISFQSTMMFERLLREEWPLERVVLKALRTAGDKLNRCPVRQYPFRLYNLYGPTEDTVWTTWTEVTFETDERKDPTIGKPLGNHQVYIFGTSLHPQPINVPGELCISGTGLARGYLNRPQLTSEKFDHDEKKNYKLQNTNYKQITNHKLQITKKTTHQLARINEKFLRGVQGGSFYKKRPPGRRRQKLYKTGDLARWLSDGNIEFLGRIDSQVKIRGFRIELSEVESKLTDHLEINEAVVIVRKVSTKSTGTDSTDSEDDLALCAYIVSTRDIPGTELREYLSGELPDYMIPSYFVRLEAIPLTPGGKIDRRALPVPKVRVREDYVGPRDELEKKLQRIWSELLGIPAEKISIHDNFFHLGGHSLKATLLAAQIHKELNVSVPLQEIFKTPAIKNLAVYIKKEAPQYKYISIEPAEAKEYYILSSVQERLYVLQQMDLENTVYNIPSVMTLKGEVNRKKFEEIFKQLIQRHESLRTSFVIADEQPVQQIHDKVEFEMEYYSAKRKAQSAVRKDGRCASTIKNFIRPFDLSQAPLMRVGLIKLPHTPTALRGHPRRGTYNSKEGKEEKYLLMVDMHHIISDGTSTGVLVKEFMSLYGGEDLPAPRIHYKDFSRWQNSEKMRETINQQEAYWLKEFAREIPGLDIPTDYPRPAVRSFEGSNFSFEINEKETRALNEMARDEGATLFIVLLAIYNIFLSKLSSQEDIIVGTPTAGRRHHELGSIIGMFVNTLVLRNFPNPDKPFIQFLNEVKGRTLKAFENQDYPFEELVDKVTVNRDTSRNPLFDTMLTLQNFDIPGIEIPGLKLSPYRYENSTAKFDLTLYASESEEGLHFIFEYCTKLFKPGTPERFIGYFKRIISQVIERPDGKISKLEIISEEEKQQIIFDFNATASEFPRSKTLHQLFAEQVKQAPDHTALVGDVCAGVHLSYSQLNEKANQLAHLLKEKAVEPDTIVGIMMERSIEMIIGIFGIIKAGGAYLPIDPHYPKERILYMLNDSKTRILLTLPGIPGNPGNDIETVDIASVKGHPHWEENLPHPGTKNHLAYVIYTSGSTGRPKGVLIDHHSIVNRLNWMQKKYPISRQDTLLQKTPFTFDVSVWEIFWWSITGARLSILVPGGEKDPAEIIEAIEKNDVTVVHFVPSMLSIFLQYLKNRGGMKKLAGLKQVIASGEALTVNQVEKFNHLLHRDNHTSLANLYGPTEAAVDVSYFDCLEMDNPGKIPIGKPIDNIRLLILSKDHHILPVGITGELCISGVGLARGYLNRPRLTSEKFIKFYRSYRSYMTYIPKKIYKTGDLAQWLPDGNIEFLGRMDHQVKIRGFRIELEEIENRLLNHDEIKEAIVVSKEDNSGDKYLCAYIVPGQDMQVPVSKLVEYLSGYLPDYMVPAYFVKLEKFPLTPSGKTDVKALPAPEPEKGVQYVPPRDLVETKLVRLWSDVLGIEPGLISIESNFFQMGGHSLKATLLTARIHKELNVNVPLLQVFKTPLLKGLAQYIKQEAAPHAYISIEPVEKKEYYILSPAQQRLYILQQMELQSTVYNIPSVMIWEGPLDREKFAEAFREMIRRHESLRTSFEIVQGKPVQEIHEEKEFDLDFHDLPDCHDLNDCMKLFIRPFDLSKAPLLRVGLIKLLPTSSALRGHPSQEGKGDRYLLLVDMHHIIADGTSTNVLINDFMKTYKNEDLAPQKIQYKDFSQWQNHKKLNEIIRRQELYWLEQFPGEITVLNLPTDYPRPLMQSFAGHTIYFELDRQETRALKSLAHEQGATLFMVLLAIYTIFLAKISGQEDIVVGTPIAGRRHADLESVIGMFVNTLALRNYINSRESFPGFLGKVKEKTLQAFDNQEYQFENLVEKAAARDMSRNPLFDVMFILQNMIEPYGNTTEIKNQDLKLKPLTYENKTSKFDLTLVAIEAEEKLEFAFEYCIKLFKKETIVRFIKYLKEIVSSAAGNPGIRISEIEIITEEEKQQLLAAFNATRAVYPEDKTLHELFEIQAKKTPARTCVIEAGNAVSITYRELNQKANQLAKILRKKGAGLDEVVGIMKERSLEMLIGILGILKAGAAYLPIAPDYPQERIDYMLKDSGTKILLSEGHTPDFPASQLPSFSHLPNFSSSQLPSFSLAYIIYTSGSTGMPKGVMVDHRSAVNILSALQKEYPLLETDTYLLKTSCAFDVSVTELFGWFFGGGRLAVLEKNGEKDPEKILDTIEKAYITHINFVPAMFHVFLEALSQRQVINLSCLKYIFLAGEALLPDLVRKFRRLNTKTQLENIYGPTEGTVYTSKYSLSQWEASSSIVPIGKPMQNTRIYILGRCNGLQPIGVPGELCIGGLGVARGYLNNPVLTAERFINRSYRSYKSYIYKSGDLARWLVDGNIEFLGRIDQQVKIRGFRVEPGEIENQLVSHEHVKEVVVHVREETPGDKYLCAYIVPTDTTAAHSLEPRQLRSFLSGKLPAYMIPSYFVLMGEIPLTPSGKVNGKALPEPDRKTPEPDYIAPQDEIEEKLAAIWSETLRIEESAIGINSNFFALGGHSLKATIMVSKINKKFNINIPLPEIFKNPTVKQLAKFIKGAVKHEFLSIEPVEKKEYYILSSAQKRLYVLQQMDPENSVYNIPSIMILEGPLNREKLAETLQGLIHRHESLRTSFDIVKGEAIQRIHDEVEFDLDHHDLKDFHDLNDCIKLFIRPFDLSQVPVLRVGLVNTTVETKHILMLDIHHIISDGTSAGVFFNELMSLYNTQHLPEPRIHYKDFSQWQTSKQVKETISQQEACWLKEFSGEIPVLHIMTDYPRPAIQSFEGSCLRFQVNEKETSALNEIARSQGATLFIVLLAVYNILLAKISSQEDIIVGTPIAGRTYADMETIIGMFVNTLPLRNFPIGDETFTGFLKAVKKKTLHAFANQEYPFEDLVEKVTVERDMSRNPLFDVMFIFQNMFDPSGYIGKTAKIQMKELNITPYDYESQTAKFDLTLTAVEEQNKLSFSIDYCTKLFKKETIGKFINYFNKIISSVINNPGMKVSEIEIITAEEKQQILKEFNDTEVEYAFNKTVHELFVNQANQAPHRTALKGQTLNSKSQIPNQESSFGRVNAFGGMHISYKELNQKSHQLACLLREKGVRSGTIVGLMTARTVEMMVGILGILKAGSAYLPIVPGYPEERINYILKDSETNILLTDNDLSFSPEASKICPQDTSLSGIWDLGFGISPRQGGQLAYVIYTSGSTGRPKGVMIRHDSVVNFIKGMTDLIDFKDTDKILCLTEVTFDIFGLETLVPLTCGSAVVMGTSYHQVEPAAALGVLCKERATIFQTTPSRLHLLLAYDRVKALKSLSILRYLLVGGEAFPRELAEQLGPTAAENGVILYNLYGPTETTIWSSAKNLTGQVPLTIGKPIANTGIYILDKHLKLLPPGIAGEICIAGRGLAPGYLNRPGLTAEKFCLRRPGGRFLLKGTGKGINRSHLSYMSYIYKTGDRGRWLEDGDIEFLGRVDFQVKIRGHRIELAEIENCLLNSKEIKEAVVTDRLDEKGDRYLAAYFVADKSFKTQELVEYLGRELPVYMIPSYFVRVDKIPLTSSGKVDRKSLPAPVIKEGDNYQAPRIEIERKLADIWSEVLEIEKEKISINDNFFHLGGHSLKAALMVSRVHKELNVRIPLPEIFKTSHIRGLAAYIKESVQEKYISIGPVEKREYYQLSSAQKRLYILLQLDPESTVYNIPSVMILTGQLHKQRFAKALRDMVRQHEILRTSFEVVKGEPMQRIHDEVEFDLDFHDLQDFQDLNDCIKLFIRPFDLSRAPLLRVGVIKLLHTPSALPGHPRRGAHNSKEGKENKYLLMVDMHHIISDGTSAGVFFNQLMSFYGNQPLQEPRIHYKDFSQWQSSDRMKDVISLQEAYWLKEFNGEIPVLHIMSDYPRPAFQRFEGSSIDFQVNKRETRALNQIGLSAGTTLFMVLLALYNIFLAKISSQEDIVVGTPTAGRRHADLETLIGMFVNTLALRNFPIGENTFTGFLSTVKEKTLQAFENQEYPFENLVEKVAVERDMSRNPLFDVMFILQNMFDPSGNVEKTARTEITGLKITPYNHENQTVRFDLTLNAIEKQGKLYFSFDYCTKLFKKETISKFINYFNKIISSVVDDPGMKISQIQIITEAEKQQILKEFNDTEVEYAFNKTVHELFANQVKQTPHHTALKGQIPNQESSFGGMHISYKELNRKSHHLACLLREKGVRPGTIVGLMTERTVEMMVGILGILKAGSAYLPLTREYPEERINYILKDSETNILLTDNDLSFSPEASKICPRDTSLFGIWDLGFGISPRQGGQLAYVIYTSGSTGRPKGVMIRHDSVVNFTKGMTDLIDFKDTDKVLCLTEVTFDIFGLETLVPLTRGSTVIMGTQDQQLEPRRALYALEKEKATIFQATPSRLQLLLTYDRAKALKSLSILRYLLVGGEAFPRELAEQLGPTAAENGVILYNLYGPTETTIWSSAKNLTGQVPLTIGKPIANTGIYILDKHLKLLPPGIAGEICIAGRGLAPGYLNRPGLTAEKFCLRRPGAPRRGGPICCANRLSWFSSVSGLGRDMLRNSLLSFPSSQLPNFPASPFSPPRKNFSLNRSHLSYMSYIYKTGDLGRWLEDGDIEFLGRVDFQVKIRGHRIELTEIENCLLGCKEIKEVVVTDRESETGDKYLAAYFVADKSFKAEELMEHLGQQLPGYMIPSYFVQLDGIPLTVSGKVDRKALPAPGTRGEPAGNSYRPPKTGEEKIIAEIWSDFLGVDKIGINDNFFTIGGHSLQAVRVISRIREIFNLEVSLRFLFENPTVQRLADAITRLQIETIGKQDMEKILMQIDNMTDQEAELLLDRLNIRKSF